MPLTRCVKDQELRAVDTGEDSGLSSNVYLWLGNEIIRVCGNDDGANILGRDGLPGRVSRDFGILVRALELFGILHNAEVVFPAADCQ